MYKWFERFYYVIITQYNFLLAHNIFVHTLRVITQQSVPSVRIGANVTYRVNVSTSAIRFTKLEIRISDAELPSESRTDYVVTSSMFRH
jgi:hypothetical protein